MNISDIVIRMDFKNPFKGKDILNALEYIDNTYSNVVKNTVTLGLDVFDKDLLLFRIEIGSYVWTSIFGKEINMPSPSMELILDGNYKNIALRFYSDKNTLPVSLDYHLDRLVPQSMMQFKEMLEYALKQL